MRFLSALFFLLAFPSLAWADPASGLPLIATTLSILPAMMVCTWLGGGYRVLKSFQTEDRRHPDYSFLFAFPLYFIIVALALGVGAWLGNPLLMVMTVIFALVALVRAWRMWKWAQASEERDPPEHVEEVNPFRLRVAAVALVIITLLLIGGSYYFRDETDPGLIAHQTPVSQDLLKGEKLRAHQKSPGAGRIGS